MTENGAMLRASKDAMLRVCDVRKSYRSGGGMLEVLRGVDFNLEPGGFAAVIGQSGSGKSTLLHLMGLLDAPDSGEVHLQGTRIDNLPAARRDRLALAQAVQAREAQGHLKRRGRRWLRQAACRRAPYASVP